MRLTPPTDSAAARAIMDEAIGAAEREIVGVKGSYVVTGDRPYVEKDANAPLLLALEKVCKEESGGVDVGIFTGYTDTAVIAGTLHNPNCMSYGPGSLKLAHKPNEYVPVADIERCERVLTRLMSQFAFF